MGAPLEQGAIDVVRAVFDEYRFSWDAEDYHRDLFTIEETYLATGGGFRVLLAGERVVGCIGALDRGDGVVEGGAALSPGGAAWTGRGGEAVPASDRLGAGAWLRTADRLVG